MSNKIQVWYHKNCADGLAAAAVMMEFLHGIVGTVEYHAIQYGDALPAVGADDRIYMVDFSVSLNDLHAIYQAGPKCVTIIDHHESFAENVPALKKSGYLGLEIRYDGNKCGAVLAWEYCFPQSSVPYFLEYIQDRDLWQWRHGEKSRVISAGIRLMDQTIEAYNEMLFSFGDQFNDIFHQGLAAGRMTQKYVEASMAKAVFCSFRGVDAVMVNASWTMCNSELGEGLLKNNPAAQVAVMWWEEEDGGRVYSLRSRKDYSCLPIAQAMGGGGHAQACAFKVEPLMERIG